MEKRTVSKLIINSTMSLQVTGHRSQVHGEATYPVSLRRNYDLLFQVCGCVCVFVCIGMWVGLHALLPSGPKVDFLLSFQTGSQNKSSMKRLSILIVSAGFLSVSIPINMSRRDWAHARIKEHRDIQVHARTHLFPSLTNWLTDPLPGQLGQILNKNVAFHFQLLENHA